MSDQFTVFKQHTAGGDVQFWIWDEQYSRDDPLSGLVGLFGEDGAELAEKCVEALDAGAQTFFAGVEFRQKTCFLHIKRRNGDCTQSIVERHHGARLLTELCRRHPEMVVDLFVVFDRTCLHTTSKAKDYLLREEQAR